MSVRSSLTGPFAEITVGTGDAAVVFNLPKVLLCNSSTYFKAALNNGFSETATQSISLDDESPEVFRTYAAWLFEHEICQNVEQLACFESHMFQVYIFADKRGIIGLPNDVVTKLCSFWCDQNIGMGVTTEYLPQLSSSCTLYQMTLDSMILELRASDKDNDDGSFFSCFNSICYYHVHEDGDEKKACIKKTEAGCNVSQYYNSSLTQVVWKW
ncbi:hypothetical protein D6C76_08769 [Aureobasidium pullulans]|uniref:BTB domain-containing protein n=1 Tax=Aureobasidium pullulans TaxID=5580 RepID=A0AB74JVM1_AURPU|nr:hypothetical protein D6D11_10551 [Aureobasidium pullulans]THX28840.1 hypothetical protein D6D12_04567 [Aureobasidium pullulans]TIA67289.1 hypothetical protein D6C76_08769 [Aureobasidium pullulans]